MVKHFNPQKTIGVIGATLDAQAFILKARQLGMDTYLLCKTTEEASLITGARKIFVGSLSEKRIQEKFLRACELLVYYDETIAATEIEDIQKTVVVPQGNELLSLTQDRILQKAFLEALNLNIAPYVTVVKTEDIEAGMPSIGYPAVLSTNQLTPSKEQQSVFIYEEQEIAAAAELLKYGICVLEPWLVAEQHLSVSAVKTNKGRIELFPIVKKEYRQGRLHHIQGPAKLTEEVTEEIQRVTRVIVDAIDFQGVATIDFMVSPAGALYVGTIYPYPTMLSRFTAEACALSATEAHLRAIASLPLPSEINQTSSFVYVPFYADQREKMDDFILVQPNWKFSFYPDSYQEKTKSEEAIGEIHIKTKDTEKVLSILRETR